MSPEQWMNQYIGQSVDGGQCVAWSSFYSRNFLNVPVDIGNVAAAAEMFDHAPDGFFDKIENDPTDANQHPEEGDILIWHSWPGNQWGHTAVCSWTTNGMNFTSYDQNWPLGSTVHRQAHDFGNVRGWLRAKNRPWLNPPTPAPVVTPPVEVPVVEPTPVVETPIEVVPVEVPLETTPSTPEEVKAPPVTSTQVIQPIKVSFWSNLWYWIIKILWKGEIK